jgi:hypothetical protein
MNRIFMLIAVGALLHGTALADHLTIGFAVYRTADVKQAMTPQGGGLSSTNLRDKVIAYGHADAGSSVWVKTTAFQILIQLGASQFTKPNSGEYAFTLDWYDQKDTKAVFSLHGRVTPTKDGTLPEGWDTKDFAVVFTVEDLKQ